MRILLALLGLAALACRAASPPSVTVREIASLFAPTSIASPADGSGRLFVTAQGGLIHVIRGGTLNPAPFLDLRDVVSVAGEQGLLNIAFHPRFATNGRSFVYYTRLDGSIRISEFGLSFASPDVGDRESEREILTIPHPGATNHNGGQLAFGPDGYLYIGVGDGGSAGDPPNNAQSLSVLLGKILRIDVDGNRPYAIPPGNPFVGTAGARPEIWAYGLRNPWRFSFDRMTGDLYIGDVGQGAREEVDFVPHGAPAGMNFGWRVFEGLSCFNPPANCSLPGHTPPVLQYSHDTAGGFSITGGYVYRGVRSAALRGFYLYADFISDRVWAATREGGQWVSYLLIAPGTLSSINSFGEDESGELYAASYYGGKIYAIEGPGPGVNPAQRCDVAAGCLPRRVPR